MLECGDCSHHFQISPRGEVQVGACPDCGGKRLFRMQPNPVQSEGTLRNMVDMETGKDAGGNPDGEGILAPPGGRAILTAFAGTLCPHCNADLMGSDVCPHCGLASGIPSELRPEIAGAPLTEGGIMQTEHTDPLDTGTHGRDEYTHGSVLAGLMDDFHEQDQPRRDHERAFQEAEDARARALNRAWREETGDSTLQREVDPEHPDKECPNCGNQMMFRPDLKHYNMWPNGAYECENGQCKHMVPGEETRQLTPEHPDPWMDNEPGTMTIPEHWGSVRTADPLSDFYKGVSEIQLRGIEKPQGPVPLWEPPRQPQVSKCRNCKQPVDTQTGECPNCGQLNLIARVAAEGEHQGWTPEGWDKEQYIKTDPSDNLRCPDCHEQIMGDTPHGEDEQERLAIDPNDGRTARQLGAVLHREVRI